MGEFRIIPFHPIHLEKYVPRGQELFMPHMRDQVQYVAENSIAMTAFAGEEIVAIGGCLPQWKGVAEVWMLGTNMIPHYAKSFVRQAKIFIDVTQAGFRFHRMQCAVDVAYNCNVKFIEKLGFKYEGMMEKYGPLGEDMARYARVQ